MDDPAAAAVEYDGSQLTTPPPPLADDAPGRRQAETAAFLLDRETSHYAAIVHFEDVMGRLIQRHDSLAALFTHYDADHSGALSQEEALVLLREVIHHHVPPDQMALIVDR